MTAARNFFLNMLLASATALILSLCILVVHTDSLVQESQKRLIDTSQNLNGTIIQAGLTLDKINLLADEQHKYWTRATIATTETTEDLRAAARQTVASLGALDENVNGLLIPQAVQTLKDLNQNTNMFILSTTQNENEIIHETEGVIENLEDASKGAAERMNDPNLERAIEGLGSAAQSSAEAARNLAKTSEEVEAAVKRATKPETTAVRIVKTALDWGIRGVLILRGVR